MRVRVLTLHLQPCSEDVGRTTSRGRVDWALVEALSLSLGSSPSSHMDNRDDGVEILELHVSEVALLAA